ncbi:MAG: metallophosphoesterase [Lentisphaerae bacterium]|nr:metallophosphoesterase [Lentisphaerota bacterium]
MRIALFSDVHGRLRLALHMMQCWQIAHGSKLDAAIIAGDLGCFPDPAKFDRATRRWIERDPEEAGFSAFFVEPKAAVQAMFQEHPEHGELAAVTGPVLFTAGNHEDHAFLLNRQALGSAPGMPKGTFPVDCYGKIHCIRDGVVARFPAGDRNGIRIGALWGIENVPDGDRRKISADAARRLTSDGNGFDLLVTHDAPQHSYTGHRSSGTISEVIKARKPPVHLFGHAHPVNGQHEFNVPDLLTQSWIFEDVGFGKDCKGSLGGTMGILSWEVEWGEPKWSVEIVQDAWLSQMRHRNWQHVWP